MKEWDFIAEKLRQHPQSPEVSCDGVTPSGDFCPWPLSNSEKVEAIMEDVYTELNIENHARKRLFLQTGDPLYGCTRAGVDIFICEDEYGAPAFFPYRPAKRFGHKNQAKKRRLSGTGSSAPKGLPSQEVQAQRLEVCADCPSFNREAQACGECGCPIARLASRPGPGQAACPLRKWSD